MRSLNRQSLFRYFLGLCFAKPMYVLHPGGFHNNDGNHEDDKDNSDNHSRNIDQKAADVWKTDVWDFQAFSQTLLELRFSLGNKGKDSKNMNSQTWPGTPRRPSSRHPRPSELSVG